MYYSETTEAASRLSSSSILFQHLGLLSPVMHIIDPFRRSRNLPKLLSRLG
jgi:hypothetical protein